MDLQHLIDDYNSDDMHKRLSAIRELEQLQDVAAVPVLMRALKDAFFDVRVHAAIGLARLGDVRAVGALLLVVRDTRLDQKLLPSIYEAMAATRDPRAAEALYDFIGLSNDVSQKYELVRLLGVTQDIRIFDMLCDWLGDEDPGMAIAAADGLRLYGDRRALDHLLSYVRDPDERIREAVSKAIKSLSLR